MVAADLRIISAKCNALNTLRVGKSNTVCVGADGVRGLVNLQG